MSEDNVKVTIKFPSLRKEVETDSDSIQQLARDLKNKKKRKEILKNVGTEIIKCLHINIVAINEEGYAGVYCTDCGEQLEKEC